LYEIAANTEGVLADANILLQLLLLLLLQLLLMLVLLMLVLLMLLLLLLQMCVLWREKLIGQIPEGSESDANEFRRAAKQIGNTRVCGERRRRTRQDGSDD
jgi:hypothetical protein